jgi:hypothetical protein
MVDKPVVHKLRVQFFITGYTSWAVQGYGREREWSGCNKVVEWIVEQWLEANQDRLREYGLAEDDFAARSRKDA